MPNLTNGGGIGLGLMIVLLTATVTGQQAADARKKTPAMSSDDLDPASSAKPPSAVSSTDRSSAGLTRYALESCGLSIELPAAPADWEVSFAGPHRHLKATVRNHSSSGKGFVIVVSHLEPPGQKSFEGYLDHAVQTYFEGLSDAPGYSKVDYTPVDKSPTAVSFRGSCDLKGSPVEFEGFAQVHGRDGWIVWALHRLANAAATESAKRVLASARFDRPPCSE